MDRGGGEKPTKSFFTLKKTHAQKNKVESIYIILLFIGNVLKSANMQMTPHVLLKIIFL